jgi:Fe-S cluster assembly ATPase SufC
MITHYQRLLNYVKPNYVSIFFDGRIVMTGGPEVALHARRARLRLGGEGIQRRQIAA